MLKIFAGGHVMGTVKESQELDDNELQALWIEAMENTEEACVVQELQEIIGEMMGLPKGASIIQRSEVSPDILVISNESRDCGSGSILTDKAKREVKSYLKGYKRAVIIPSSVDEVLVVGMIDGLTVEGITETTKDINAAFVPDHKFLSNEAYEIELENWE